MRTPPHRLASSLAVAAAVLTASVLTAAPALTKALPGWSQFQGGPDHAGAVADGPAPGFETAWSTLREPGGPRDAYGLSAPVVGDGVIVAAGPTEVAAVSVSTGEPAWSIERALGPSASPALAEGPDGTLVLFTEGWGDGPPDASVTPGATGSPTPSGSPQPDAQADTERAPRFVAVPTGGDTPVWAVDLTDVSRTGVTVGDGVAFVGTIDGTVTAVDVASGTEAWTAEVGGFLESSIASTDDLVLVPVRGDEDTAAALVALSIADGSQVWRYEPQTGSSSIGPPAIGDATAYVSLPDATVRAVSLQDGSERWRTPLNSYVNPFSPASSPVVVGGGVVVADVRGQLYRLDAGTGARTWDHAYNRPVLRSSPVVVGDHVVLATADGWVAAFDLATGELVWEGSPTGPRGGSSSDPLRSIAVSDDVIVVVRGGADAGLVGLRNDPTASLIRRVSPTVLDPAGLLLAWAVGLVVAALLFVVGRALWARLGPVELPGAEGDEAPGEDR